MERKKYTTPLRSVALGVALVGALILTVPLAAAQADRGSGANRNFDRDGSRGAGRWERMAERLELTAGQQQTISEIREQTRTQNLAVGKQLLQLQNELEGALLADDIDEGKVLKLVEEIGEARTEQQKNRMRMRLAIGEELTPDQRDQWLMFKKSRSRGGRGHGHGRGVRGSSRSGCDGEGPHGRPGAECDGKGPHGCATRA